MMPVPAGAARQHDLAGAMAAVDVMVQRATLAQRHADQAALGGLGRLADRLRHLARLAVAEANAALLITDDDERRETEASAAFHHLGDAVDVHQTIDELAVAVSLVPVVAPVASATSASIVSHSLSRHLRGRRQADPARFDFSSFRGAEGKPGTGALSARR